MDDQEGFKPTLDLVLQPHSPFELGSKLKQISDIFDGLDTSQPVTIVLESLNTTPEIIEAFKEGVNKIANWGISLEDLLSRTYFASGAESQRVRSPNLSTLNLKQFMRSARVPGELTDVFNFEDQAFKTLFRIGKEISTHPNQANAILTNRLAGLDSRISRNTNLVYNAITQGFMCGKAEQRGINISFDFESNSRDQIKINMETLSYIGDQAIGLSNTLFKQGLEEATNAYSVYLTDLSNKLRLRDESIASAAQRHFDLGESVIVIAGNTHSGILNSLSDNSRNTAKLANFGPIEFSLIHRLRNNESVEQKELERSMLLYLYFNRASSKISMGELNVLAEQMRINLISHEDVLNKIRQLYQG